MRANRRRDSGPERALRSELHRRGFRFRVDYPVRPDGGRFLRPDVVFPRQMIAVFVDGCFWHGCPQHGRVPSENTGYWTPKLARNRERDHEQDERLRAAGWAVIRVWEHEAPGDAADRVEAQLRQRAVSRPLRAASAEPK